MLSIHLFIMNLGNIGCYLGGKAGGVFCIYSLFIVYILDYFVDLIYFSLVYFYRSIWFCKFNLIFIELALHKCVQSIPEKKK